jgi:class 3 adenylate cyclase
MRLLSILICFVLFQTLSAADTLTISQEESKILPGKGLAYFEDNTSKLDITSIKNQKFLRYNHDQLNFGWNAKTVWFRFHLNNKDIKEQIVFQIAYPLLDEVEIWSNSSDTQYHRLTGDIFPYRTRDVASPYFVFNLPVKAGNTAEIFVRVKSVSSMQMPMSIYSQSQYLRQVQLSNFWFGIYYGFLLVMIFYNLFIYSTLKDIRYIFYSASIFCSLFFFSTIHGHAAYWIWPNSVKWNQISIHVAMNLLTLTSAVFTYSFLNLPRFAPKYKYVVAATAVAGFMGVILTFIIPVYVLTKISTFVIMLDAIALTAAGFIAWKAGNKYARLFVAAWICYLLGALLLIGRNMGILPGNMVTNNFANIGSAMEVVLLSLALADKVRILRIEKEESDMKVLKMQKELTASLENKVALRTSQLQQEKDKSDKLLLNILPMSIAEELKENGKAGAKKHENVTVLFTDFVNFTKICEELEPEVLVRELDECFRLFDEITHKYNLEKIKTIGDAYLCACGVPSPIPDHAEKTILAAKEILEAINVFNAQNIQKSLPEFKIRIGVHTGPLISGVVGTRKFAYDIWGDTVNIAARMEQNSETGKINISQVTYELVRDKFDFVHRGKVKVKNKNEIDMYFLNTEN